MEKKGLSRTDALAELQKTKEVESAPGTGNEEGVENEDNEEVDSTTDTQQQ